MHISLRQSWALLTGCLQPQRLRVVALGVLICGGIGLQLANPRILRYFIDTAKSEGPLYDLVAAAGLFLGVAIAQQLLTVAATYLGENVAWKATNLLRGELAAHCLRLDMSFHKARTPGELIERIDGDVNALSDFFSQFVIGLLSNFILLVGILALLFREDWRVGAGLGASAVVGLFVLVRIRGFAVPYWDALRERSAGFFGFLGEQLAGTEDVRANGATAFVMHRCYTLLRDWLPVQVRAGLACSTVWSSMIGVFAVGNMFAFAFGASLYRAGAITIGIAYLIFYYTELLGLADWCRALPDGLDTRLPPGGLSASEAHLLAFARVFLKNPGLVILDEASSRLDPATERLVERAVSRLLEGRTGIVIAHRLQTVQRADAIMILEDARTGEYGARKQRVADPQSRFSRLLKTGLEEALA